MQVRTLEGIRKPRFRQVAHGRTESRADPVRTTADAVRCPRCPVCEGGLWGGPRIHDDDRGKGGSKWRRPTVKRAVNTAFPASDNLCRHAARVPQARGLHHAQARRPVAGTRE
ncbi:hypothetical protein GCM10023257_20510 [Streptomyces hyderabadensis]|uniref:Uncharacterized protein n=1 Tax=Streptomyces hyderabadensis TaxID=598549 RepID=A0ABP9HYF0_9ACTN